MSSDKTFSTTRWADVQSLLHDALDQPPEAREAWLASCEADGTLIVEVRSLLAADAQAERFLEVDALGAWQEIGGVAHDAIAHGAPHAVRAGIRIGPFEIVRLLGRGGMGQVWLAVRADDAFRQEVAIKVADRAAADDSLRRLHRERQILADLHHPNIARLYDGGSLASGWPYLVMEHITGQPIDRWVQARQLSLRARLHLFRKVLAAVAYAHRHLIVHLDLKPANILVTAPGEPKLLDFGIAKLLEPVDAPGHSNLGHSSQTHSNPGQTTLGQRPLSPAYASPEQLRGERLTVASDIYSLGVVLRQLLTGAAPQRAGEDAASAEPSSRRDHPRLPRDLEAILLKATVDSADQRYGSAEALDQDLARYLQGQPVRARQATWHYRATRLARRHWLALGLAGALFIAALSGAAVFSIQARRLAGERDRAELARAEAEDVGTFLGELFNRIEPGELETTTLSVPDVLDRGIAVMEQHPQRPAVRARLLATLGRTYRVWGRYEPARSALDQALALEIDRLGTDHPAVAEVRNELGRLDVDLGAYEDAIHKHRQALASLEEHFGARDLRVAETLTLLGDAMFEASRPAQAAPLLHRGCAIREQQHGAEHPDTARCRTLLAKVNIALGNADIALEQASSSVRVLEAARAPDHPDLTEALNMEGYALMRLERFAEAETAIRRVLDIRMRTYPDDHVRIAESLSNLAVLLSKVGRDPEAEAASRQALAIVDRHNGAGSDRAANIQHNLAVALRNQGRLSEAETALRASIDILRRTQPGSYLLSHPLSLLAELAAGQGRQADAMSFATEAHGLVHGALGAEHPHTKRLRQALARYTERPGT